MTVSVGDKLRCTGPGSTLLVKGRTYTAHDITGQGLIEVAGLRGFLFGEWRFKPLPPAPQNAGGE